MNKVTKKYQFSNSTITGFNFKMVELCYWLLLFSFQILIITSFKPHYAIVSFICALLLIINIQPYINLFKSLYFIPLIISVLFHVVNQKVDTAFILSLLNYLIIPFVFFNHNFQEFNLHKSIFNFTWFTVLCFLGLLIQLIGIESPLLDLEFAITDGAVNHRYGSIAGSTLVLGFFTSISSIYCYYNFIYLNDKSKLNIGMLIISIVSLFLAQSRRYYIFTFILFILIYFFGKNKQITIKHFLRKNQYYIGGIIFLLFIAFQLKDEVFFFARFFSTFDYKNDASNVLRAIKWLEAIQNFINNIWFGAGLGNMGAVGKNIGELTPEELTVAESYYLKVFVEGGVFFGCAFMVLVIYTLHKSLKLVKEKNVNSFAAYIFIFFFLDCFMSMTLEYVIASIMFWISIAVILKPTSIV